jgi:hypothetical protein
VAQLKYLGTTVTCQNLIQEGIKRALNSGNAYYHSVQNLLSSRLLSKKVKIGIYKTIILPVLLYGYETWYLTLMQGAEENIWDEVTGGWKKQHNEELHNLYSSLRIIRMIKSSRIRCEAHVACMGENSAAYRYLVGNPEGKRSLGRPRRR